MPGAAVDHLLMHRVEGIAILLDRGAEDRLVTKSSIGRTLRIASSTGIDAVAVEPDQPAGVFEAGIIAVDQGDLVAMAHGAQRRTAGPGSAAGQCPSAWSISLKRTFWSMR